jgi:hypothetical protein
VRSKLVFLLVAGLMSVAAPSAAEPDRVTTTEHFRFVYRPRYHPVIRRTIEAADTVRDEVIRRVGAPVIEPVTEVRMARNIDEMRSLSPRPPPDYADAVAFWPDNVMVISLTSSQHRPVTLDTVFRHELAHMALRWVIGDAHVPRWFNEGLAVVTSDELPMERLKLLWPAVARGEVTPLKRLDRSFPPRDFQVNQAYAESADFVRFLVRFRGRWRFQELLVRVRDGEPFDAAMAATWGMPVRELEDEWHDDLRRRYSVVPSVTAGLTLWVAVGVFLVVVYVKRRRDVRRRIAAMSDGPEGRDSQVGDTGP